MTTNPLDIPALSKEFMRLTGGCWHEQIDNQTLKCKHCGQGMLFPWQTNSDLTDAREVIRVMRKREDWPEFCSSVGFRGTSGGYFDGIHYNPEWWELIDIKYLLAPGALLDAVVEWMEARK